MTSTRAKLAATLAAACLLGLGRLAAAQDKPRDEGLEKLLEKIDEPRAADKAKDSDKDKPKADDKAKDKAGEKADKPGKPAGGVEAEDKGLDKLLEGLGQIKDAPAPDDKKEGGPGGEPKPPMPDQGKKGGEPLDPNSKEIDDLLGQKAGDKPKKKPGDDKKGDKGDGQDGGPLGDVIKQMRDVEERLGKPDTGEETRKKQTEIVKNLDTLIEQMKNAKSQSQGLKMIRQGQKPGGPPNGQANNQPGATGDGVGNQKPEKPRTPPPPIELAKDVWGQLPPQFRDDMANILNEHPLPTKTDLIRLYYLSLGKKTSTNREE